MCCGAACKLLNQVVTMEKALFIILYMSFRSFPSVSGNSDAALFRIYAEKSPTSLTALTTLTSSSARKLSCHSECLSRDDCMSFMTSSDHCTLYDSYITDQQTQLQTQTGNTFFNLGKV